MFRNALRVVVAVVVLGVAAVGARAQVINNAIGFSPNHVFDGALAGENVDVLNGNLSLKIPIGPRFELNDRFGYQVTLYYNSKIW